MWSFGGIRIFVQDYISDDDQIIAELNPLAGGSIYHTFGYEDPKIKLNVYVVGWDDTTSLRNLSKTGEKYTLETPWFTITSGYLLKHITRKMVMSNCQTLRSDLPSDSPVFICDLELWNDVN